MIVLKASLILLVACIAQCHYSNTRKAKHDKITSHLSLSDEWRAFKEKHDKKYESEHEELRRLKIFAHHLNYIAKHNELFNKGHVTYTMKMNKFGDMTEEEFSKMHGFRRSKLTQHDEKLSIKKVKIIPSELNLPNETDWRKKGAVTDVKDQGRCGSCWTFSATGALEGQHFLKTGKLVSFSEQNLIDCASAFGNGGCEGGFPRRAYNYIEQNGGLEDNSTYGYEGKNKRCRYEAKKSKVQVYGYKWTTPEDEIALQEAVATVGPLSVGLDAHGVGLRFYNHGVFFNSTCTTTDLNHAVLIVGYGTWHHAQIKRVYLDYWLVKNSWGKDWGEDGYFKIARNRGNHCGIANEAIYPVTG